MNLFNKDVQLVTHICLWYCFRHIKIYGKVSFFLRSPTALECTRTCCNSKRCPKPGLHERIQNTNTPFKMGFYSHLSHTVPHPPSFYSDIYCLNVSVSFYSVHCSALGVREVHYKCLFYAYYYFNIFIYMVCIQNVALVMLFTCSR